MVPGDKQISHPYCSQESVLVCVTQAQRVSNIVVAHRLPTIANDAQIPFNLTRTGNYMRTVVTATVLLPQYNTTKL